MLIKDLPKDTNLGGIKFRYPKDNQVYIWKSQWGLGIWAKKPNNPNPDQVFPLFVDNLEEVLEWEVIDYKNDNE